MHGFPTEHRLCNINRWNLFSHQQSRWGCEETRAKEATSQCEDIQKTLNENNLCYNFAILFQTNNKIITNIIAHIEM